MNSLILRQMKSIVESSHAISNYFRRIETKNTNEPHSVNDEVGGTLLLHFVVRFSMVAPLCISSQRTESLGHMCDVMSRVKSEHLRVGKLLPVVLPPNDVIQVEPRVFHAKSDPLTKAPLTSFPVATLDSIIGTTRARQSLSKSSP